MQEVDVGRRRTVSAHRAAAARERRWQLRNWSGQPALAAHARLPDYERTAREKLLLLVELDAGSVGNLLLDEGERLSEIFWGVGGPSWKSSGPTGGHLSGELCECPTGGHLSESCAIAAQAKPLRPSSFARTRCSWAKMQEGTPSAPPPSRDWEDGNAPAAPGGGRRPISARLRATVEAPCVALSFLRTEDGL